MARMMPEAKTSIARMKSGQGLRILYDGLIYRTQLAGGINRYLPNLIVRLPQVLCPAW